ncbi:MAG: (2Fe-2S) ferredoxin domain-containing protein [Limnothrix sp.]
MPKEIIEVHSPLQPGDRHILICQNTSCQDQQAAVILDAFKAADLPENIKVCASNCQGQCSIAPTVRVVPDETWYCRVQVEDVPQLCEAIAKGELVREKLNPRIHRYL